MRDFIESFQNFDVVDLIIIQPISQNVLLETVKEGIWTHLCMTSKTELLPSH